jgi:hypothetical protein
MLDDELVAGGVATTGVGVVVGSGIGVGVTVILSTS